jgi:hypothetical protein
MKIFRTEFDNEEMQEFNDFKEGIEALEAMLAEIRQIIGYRRTMLKNADKKLQEFQDTIYAMIMEEEYPRKKYFIAEDDANDPESS